MTMKLNHLHLKSTDPKQTAQFYVDTLGATIVSEIGTRGYRLNLHGLTVNLTTHVEDQTRQQHYGMEHFALDTDDLDGTVAVPVKGNTRQHGGKTWRVEHVTTDRAAPNTLSIYCVYLKEVEN